MKARSLKLICVSLIATALTFTAAPAFAVTECKVSVKNFFVGDGLLYINWSNGGIGIISQEDPDFKPTLAVVTVAMTNRKELLVRYADGANCTGQQNIIGIWLTNDPSP